MDEIVENHRSRSWCSTAACAATPATASGPIKKPRRCGGGALIARGHRDIAFITGSLDSPTGVERLSGYKDALAGTAFR
jgi:LacI family asc operon transcriptional repressor